jgi:spermidine synthase
VIPFVGDLYDALAENGRWHHFPFDLVLLDVDNGPGRLAAAGNARLYDPDGLRRCRDALRPGGVLAIWSPCHDAPFLAALREVFPDAAEVDTRPWSSAVGEIPDVVYVARRAGP